MSTLEYTMGTGNNDYVACVITPTPQPGKTRKDFKSPVLRCLGQTNPVPSTGVTFVVPEGAPALMGALLDSEGQIPQGVTVSVYSPNSTTPISSTSINASNTVAVANGSTLTTFAVINPSAGNWTIEVQSSNNTDEFQVFISTAPTGNPLNTIDSTLEGMFDQDAVAEYNNEVGTSSACWFCTLGVIALAALVVAAILVGVALLTWESAIVTAIGLVFYGFGFTAAQGAFIIQILQILSGLVGATVLVIGTYLCVHFGACDEPKQINLNSTVIPGGISSGPAAVVFQGKLYCLNQGSGKSGNLYYNVSSDCATWQSSETQVNGARMSSSPAAVVFNGLLYCLYQGSGNDGNLYFTTFDGTTWAQQSQVTGARMSAAPAAAVFNGLLYCLYQGSGDNGNLYFTTFDGTTWAQQSQVTGARMSNAPTAVVFNELLYCLYQGSGTDGNLYFTTFDGTTWSQQSQVTGARMSSSPAAVGFGETLYCLYQGSGNSGDLLFSTYDGTAWKTQLQITGISMSSNPDCLIVGTKVSQPQLCCLFQGGGNNGIIYFQEVTSGNDPIISGLSALLARQS